MSTWVKVLNSMPQHPKVLKAGERAAWLHVCGLCYSNEHLTDGFIAAHVLPVVAPGVKSLDGLAQKLVEAGLWHEVDGGWQIHGYGEHQRSSAEIRERKAKDAERKAGYRSVRSPQTVRAESARIPCGVQSVEVEGRKQKAEKTYSDDERRLSQMLADRILANDPKATPNPMSDRWLNDMRLLIRDRGGDVAGIERIINWCQADAFWRSNILSPAKLRKQFTQLVLKAEEGKVASLSSRRDQVVAARNRFVQTREGTA